MSKGTRWRSKEDLIMVETLTEFVAKGVSIHEAFETVSERLNGDRSPKACYARWVNKLEKIYGESIYLAEKKQKEHAKHVVDALMEQYHNQPVQILPHVTPTVEIVSQSSTNPTEELSFDNVMSFLQKMNSQLNHTKSEYNQLMEELDRSWNEIEKLKMQLIEFDEIRPKVDIIKQLSTKIESVVV
jgi:hypothetical protein